MATKKKEVKPEYNTVKTNEGHTVVVLQEVDLGYLVCLSSGGGPVVFVPKEDVV